MLTLMLTLITLTINFVLVSFFGCQSSLGNAYIIHFSIVSKLTFPFLTHCTPLPNNQSFRCFNKSIDKIIKFKVFFFFRINITYFNKSTFFFLFYFIENYETTRMHSMSHTARFRTPLTILSLPQLIFNIHHPISASTGHSHNFSAPHHLFPPSIAI